jgi:hypothetical protein
MMPLSRFRDDTGIPPPPASHLQRAVRRTNQLWDARVAGHPLGEAFASRP